MTERLTIAVEDGTRDKLRELAGGERKVGAYISKLVSIVHAYNVSEDARLGLTVHTHVRTADEPVQSVEYEQIVEAYLSDLLQQLSVTSKRLDELEKLVGASRED